VDCVTQDPTASGPALASLQLPLTGSNGGTITSDAGSGIAMPAASYQKFTSQSGLGHFLEEQYHIRTPQELSSCETCHR
jgi:hypothetical protein